MSDTASHEVTAAENKTALFSPVEIEQFGADDVSAGGSIGKMLSALFLYTVLAMGIAGWWTWSSIRADKAAASERDQKHQGDHIHAPTSH